LVQENGFATKGSPPQGTSPVPRVLTLKECFEPARDFDETLPEDCVQLQLKRGVTIEQLVAAAKAGSIEKLNDFFDDLDTIFLWEFYGFTWRHVSDYKLVLTVEIDESYRCMTFISDLMLCFLIAT
jgi:hypothetical protein